jgi:hypothetical protein
MFQPDSGKYLTSFPPNNGLKLGNPIPSTVECKPIQAPGNSSFYQSCKLPLEADHTGIRICFGPNDINSSDGKTVYATSLLEMITDDSLLNKAPIGYDYRWNYVVPNGCRDIFDANVIYFLVGPADYKPTDYWNPSKVESVTPIIQYIDSH